MSININGDTIAKFGAKLPTPYMEKIWVRDTTIDIQLSFYFEEEPGVAEELFREYLDSLSDLKYSVVAVIDSELPSMEQLESLMMPHDSKLYDEEERYKKYGPVNLGSAGTGLFKNLKSKNISVFDIARYNNSDLSSEDSTWSAPVPVYDAFIEESVYDYVLFPLASFTLDSANSVSKPNNSTVLISERLELVHEDTPFQRDLLYKNDGTAVHKYTALFTVQDNNRTPLNDSIESFILSMSKGIEVHFVAFTTSLEEYPEFTDEQLMDIKNQTPAGQLKTLQVSDLCYELVSKDGSIKSDTELIFKDPAGLVYDGEVLQAIDSIYYGNQDINNKKIVRAFQNLIGSTTDDDLQDKYDNLAYILLVYGNEIDILPRLNTFRKTFLETSTATAVGRFHEQLEIRLYNINNAVKREGIQLNKFLNLNPTVVDVRTSTYTGAEYLPPFMDPASLRPIYDHRHANEFVYTSRAKLGSYALPAGTMWNDETIKAAYDNTHAALLAAKANKDTLFKVLEYQYHEFLDTVQAQCFILWDPNAITEYVNENNHIDEVFTFKVKKESGDPNRYQKHHFFEWSDTKYVMSFEPKGWLEEKFDAFIGFIVGIVGAVIGIAATPITGFVDIVTWGSIGENGLTLAHFGVYADAHDKIINDYKAQIAAGNLGSNGVLGDFRSGGAKGFETRENYDHPWGVAPQNTSNFTAKQRFYEAAAEAGEAQLEGTGLEDYYAGAALKVGATKFRTDEDISDVYASISVPFYDEGTASTVGSNSYEEELSFPVFPLADASHLEPEDGPIMTTIAGMDDGSFKEVTIRNFTNEKMNSTARKRIARAIRSINRENDRGDGPSPKVFDPYEEIGAMYIFYVLSYRDYIGAMADYLILKNMVSEWQELAEMNADVFYEKYNLYLSGFVFFDYEKALKTTSELSNLMDVSKIESLFGRELTHSFYNLRKTTLSKFFDTTLETTSGTSYSAADYQWLRDGFLDVDAVDLGKVTTTYAPVDHIAQVSENLIEKVSPLAEQLSENSDAHGAYINTSLTQESFSGVEAESKKVITSFLPRNFRLLNPTQGENNYRLMAFELVDSAGPFDAATSSEHDQSADGAFDVNSYDYGEDQLFTAWQPENYYTVEIELNDRTRDISTLLIKSYEKMLFTDYEEYYERAIEECSYNDADQMFNKFFIDGINNAYSEAPSDAPWYRAPIVYHTHLDIILDAYGGNEESIKAAALRDVEKIHPNVATLEQLNAFRIKIQSLWDDYYGPHGQIALRAKAIFESYEEDETLGSFSNYRTTFGASSASDPNYVERYAATIRNIPNPVNISYLGYSSLSGDVVAINTEIE